MLLTSKKHIQKIFYPLEIKILEILLLTITSRLHYSIIMYKNLLRIKKTTAVPKRTNKLINEIRKKRRNTSIEDEGNNGAWNEEKEERKRRRCGKEARLEHLIEHFVPQAWPVQRHASAAARATLSPVAHTARLRMVRYGGQGRLGQCTTRVVKPQTRPPSWLSAIWITTAAADALRLRVRLLHTSASGMRETGKVKETERTTSRYRFHPPDPRRRTDDTRRRNARLSR